MQSKDPIKIIECPRDAMQGWKHMISTEDKIRYLQALLKVGFDTIDFGSFVSPKLIPQMADTKEVVSGVETKNSNSKLLAIIANLRGAEEALQFDKIAYLGFPFSISQTFQQRNTNSDIATSFERVREIQELCIKKGKTLVVYISMGFGNPYGDPYNEKIVFEWISKLSKLGIGIFSLADTVGVASAEQVYAITSYAIKEFSNLEIGVHLHSSPNNWKEKIDAALEAGCARFDGALKGYGGCPMANDDLVGNMNTELLVSYFTGKNLLRGIDMEAILEASQIASEIFEK
ncbi:MAG: hydroxymethylglutaryl-CoA lyase [Bacteroidetes bacterium]|nr:MAG: hydroxymethylglutaryl-CoA lyase [Bacteroidota bacterium]